jgi:hypothetical protein
MWANKSSIIWETRYVPSHKITAPWSCRWRITLPKAWFTARIAVWEYHCSPDNKSPALVEEVELTAPAFTFASRNTRFKRTRASALGAYGMPVAKEKRQS